ncbi:DMT family transporter [Alteribacillus sp. HJP-4]|uniref:DMT family transporter n=1 Tax=Alteribacillus sp. HJP-4 TaxID=2775394 RepID=UPI0035CD27B0
MKAYIFLLITVIIFSGNIIVGKAISDLPPFTIAFSRVTLAFLIILPIGLSQAIKYKSTFVSEWKPLLGMALTGVAFFNALIYASLQFTSPTNVAIMESAIPVVTILISLLFLKEKLRPLQWIGVLLSVGGAVWVITNGSWQVLASMAFNIGDVIMIGAVVTWVSYSMLVKYHMMKFPVYGTLVVMLAIAILALLPFAAVEWFRLGWPDLWRADRLLGVAYLGIFPSVIALILYNKAIEEVGPSISAVFLNLLPVFTMAGALLFLGENVTHVQLIGAFIVISGVFLTTVRRKSLKKKPAVIKNL